jgi:hypothetical protein
MVKDRQNALEAGARLAYAFVKTRGLTLLNIVNAQDIAQCIVTGCSEQWQNRYP